MFRLDWASADLDGQNVVSDGTSSVGVTVSAPGTADGASWRIGFIEDDPYALRSRDHSETTELGVQFDAPVENVTFDLYDVDSGTTGCIWDDRVTVIALDADGNEVQVTFSNLAATHDVDGNSIEGNGNAAPTVEGPGGADSVTVTIAGPIVSFTILHSNGDSATSAGTVGLGDLGFGLASGLDGIVQGTAVGELIDATYENDPHGDKVDSGDNIDPSAAPDELDDDVIQAGGGDDTVRAGLGDDTVEGGEGNDDIDGGLGDDDLRGGAGDDTIEGGDGDDIVDGGTGDDDLSGGEGDDTLIGGDGDGNDTLDGGGSGDDLLIGGDGNDSLSGNEENDTLDGGTGDDTLLGGSGNDSIDAGDGNDVVEAGLPGLPDLGYPGIVQADPNPFNDLDFVDGGAGDDVISTGDDADTILGGSGNDTIDGGLDADDIQGGTGNDSIIGGEGSDTILAGEGNDTIFGGLGRPDDPINIPDDGSGPFGPDLVPNNGLDSIDGGAGDDLIFGEDDDDTLVGGIGNDTLDGGIDDDHLRGGDGADELIGGQGDDSLEGGDGDDSLVGGEGDDTLEGGAGNDTIDLLDTDGGRDVALGGDDRDTFINARPGDEVVVGGEGGDDFDVLDLTGGGPLRVNFTNDDPSTESGTVDFFDGDGNITDTLNFAEIEQVIPCFTPGSRVATPNGEVYVEDLTVGDKVLTRDNGVQTIEWVGHKFVSGAQVAAMPQMRPILIRAGSLGGGLPENDMLVSPNHRMLIVQDRNSLYFDEREVLVAAKHLVDGRGIMRAGVEGVTYIHFMFSQHEVVLCDGAWTESFQPGDYSLAGLDQDQRQEILTLFPELATQDGLGSYDAARRTLKKHEALLLAN